MTVARILAVKGHSVLVIPAEETVAAAARVLAERRIGSVVVTDANGRVVGIISERDLVRVLAERGGDCLRMKVADVMTRDVVTTTPHMRIAEVMERMTLGKFRHLPVVVDGKLDGIISIGDVVKHRLAEMEAEKEALKEYIASA